MMPLKQASKIWHLPLAMDSMGTFHSPPLFALVHLWIPPSHHALTDTSLQQSPEDLRQHQSNAQVNPITQFYFEIIRTYNFIDHILNFQYKTRLQNDISCFSTYINGTSGEKLSCTQNPLLRLIPHHTSYTCSSLVRIPFKVPGDT